MAGYTIHPTAAVDPSCELGEGVEIGPFCVVRGEVRLGAGVRLIAAVHIEGPVEIGVGSILYPGACIGFPAQDFKFRPGSPTAGVKIGSGCVIREHVTIHAASKAPGEGPPTTVGDNCFFMACAHAGHDARIANNVILVNNALLAGHSEVHERATMSGNTALHQFARVGKYAFVSGGSALSRDVPPYVIAAGRNAMYGVNVVGLRRAGFPREQITGIRRAFREAFLTPRPRSEQIAVLREIAADCPPVAEMAEFLSTSKRGIVAYAASPEAVESEE
jgi:UDP-N-acetylglucosamine acyltransferase